MRGRPAGSDHTSHQNQASAIPSASTTTTTTPPPLTPGHVPAVLLTLGDVAVSMESGKAQHKVGTQLSALDATRSETDTQVEDEAGRHGQMTPRRPGALQPKAGSSRALCFLSPKPDPGDPLPPRRCCREPVRACVALHMTGN